MIEDVWSIWDLDGCLSEDEARRLESTHEAYHLRCVEDPVRQPEASLLRAWRMTNPLHLVAIFTGRPAWARTWTVEWLKKMDLWPYVDLLMMRDSDDVRHVEDVKRDMVRTFATPRRTIAFAVDDHPRVIDMYRSEGIPCLRSIIQNEETRHG